MVKAINIPNPSFCMTTFLSRSGLAAGLKSTVMNFWYTPAACVPIQPPTLVNKYRRPCKVCGGCLFDRAQGLGGSLIA
jgi:hypothetical protein